MGRVSHDYEWTAGVLERITGWVRGGVDGERDGAVEQTGRAILAVPAILATVPATFYWETVANTVKNPLSVLPGKGPVETGADETPDTENAEEEEGDESEGESSPTNGPGESGGSGEGDAGSGDAAQPERATDASGSGLEEMCRDRQERQRQTDPADEQEYLDTDCSDPLTNPAPRREDSSDLDNDAVVEVTCDRDQEAGLAAGSRGDCGSTAQPGAGETGCVETPGAGIASPVSSGGLGEELWERLPACNPLLCQPLFESGWLGEGR